MIYERNTALKYVQNMPKFCLQNDCFDINLPLVLLERCRSGRTGLPAKELYLHGYRGFESLPLRNFEVEFGCELKMFSFAALFGV